MISHPVLCSFWSDATHLGTTGLLYNGCWVISGG